MSGNCNSLMVDISSAKCKRIPLAPEEVVVVVAAEMTELKRIKCCRWPLPPYVDEANNTNNNNDDDDERPNKDTDDAANDDDDDDEDGANATNDEIEEEEEGEDDEDDPFIS